ncbi:tRNA-2-methylthio-N(6)-dimethylallyladenosine synthase [Frankliniella fusca]|uniref:tRNA-2-methylthio-N(6)-dimethylallyladenosine synthase n=1 Tax=Frankliniella fusca TaxID=407009 RepID=A0AAE1L851_9NEOP|nr:tRNA-2-methylthio-N(6)-dimethylallyladenosine synthase [Frankliniella fusca]
MADDSPNPQFRVQAHLTPPAEFSFKSEEWPKWKTRWKRYAVGSGLADQEDDYKVNTLLYCMGSKADDIMLSFNLSEEEQDDYAVVLQKFDRHFGVRVNTVLERRKFLRRKQGPHESVDDFIADLHRLAENCQFGTLKEEMIRDVLVAGIKDRKLSDTLTLDSELTLDKAASKVRQKEELLRQQQQASRGEAGCSSSQSDVSYVKAGKGRHNKRPLTEREVRREVADRLILSMPWVDRYDFSPASPLHSRWSI